MGKSAKGRTNDDDALDVWCGNKENQFITFHTHKKKKQKHFLKTSQNRHISQALAARAQLAGT